MKKLILLPFTVLFFLPLSCNPVAVRSISQLASLGIKVVSLLQGCSVLCGNFSTKISDVNSGMAEGIKSNKNVLELGKYWEKYWGNICADYAELNNRLIEVDNVSQEYFIELNNNNSQISNAKLKLEDMAKTVKLREEYKKEFAKAVASLNNSAKLMKDGDDLLLILRNDVLRSALQNQISVLENITNQSNILSQNINNFSTNCIPLFTKN